jgi:hypothetical protein
LPDADLDLRRVRIERVLNTFNNPHCIATLRRLINNFTTWSCWPQYVARLALSTRTALSHRGLLSEVVACRSAWMWHSTARAIRETSAEAQNANAVTTAIVAEGS